MTADAPGSVVFLATATFTTQTTRRCGKQASSPVGGDHTPPLTDSSGINGSGSPQGGSAGTTRVAYCNMPKAGGRCPARPAAAALVDVHLGMRTMVRRRLGIEPLPFASAETSRFVGSRFFSSSSFSMRR